MSTREVIANHRYCQNVMYLARVQSQQQRDLLFTYIYTIDLLPQVSTFCFLSFYIFYLTNCLLLRFLGNVMKIGSQQLNTLDVVALVQLLVDGVGAVSRATHGQQQDILASSLLKSQGNGDTRDES